MSAMRLPIITRLRVRRAQAEHATWLAAIQDFDDPALKLRLIAAVDASIAAFPPHLLDVDTDETATLTSAFWEAPGAPEVSAQRTDFHSDRCPDRVDFGIYTDGSDPDAGPWLCTTVNDDRFESVRWMPGGGFGAPGEFLDWFEEMAS